MQVTESVEHSLTTPLWSVRAGACERPRPADLGLNTIAIGCFLASVLVLLVSVALYSEFGLSIDFGYTGPRRLGTLIGVLLAWVYYCVSPGKRREWIVPETLIAFALTLALAMVLGPAQYAAAAMNRPLVDSWLAAADAALGVHVPSLAAWTWHHPVLSTLLVQAYNSFQPQLLAVILILGVLRDRRALWEYIFQFHFYAIITVLCSAVFPVACAFTFYGFDSTLDFTRFTAHFTGMRDGTMTVIRYGDLDGLVSMPSFHAAGGLMLIWAVRRHKLLFAVAGLWNTLLIAATIFSGAHYVVDIVAAAVMFALGVWAYHTILRRFHPPDVRTPL